MEGPLGSLHILGWEAQWGERIITFSNPRDKKFQRTRQPVCACGGGEGGEGGGAGVCGARPRLSAAHPPLPLLSPCEGLSGAAKGRGAEAQGAEAAGRGGCASRCCSGAGPRELSGPCCSAGPGRAGPDWGRGDAMRGTRAAPFPPRLRPKLVLLPLLTLLFCRTRPQGELRSELVSALCRRAPRKRTSSRVNRKFAE